MKNIKIRDLVSLLILLVGAAVVVNGFLPPRTSSLYDVAGFARLPVQYGTRIAPIDSVARNTMRLFSTFTALDIPDVNSAEPGAKLTLPALTWFLDLAFRPENAERVPVFRIDDDEVLGLIGQKQQGSQYFSFLDLAPHFDDIQKAAAAADAKADDEEKLSVFEGEVQRLRDDLQVFQQLAVSFVPPGASPAEDMALWQTSLKPGQAALAAEEAGKPYDQSEFNAFTLQAKRFMDLDTNDVVGLLPPAGSVEGKWDSLGHGALDALRSGKVNPILMDYANMGEALRKDDSTAFNAAVAAAQNELGSIAPGVTRKARFETFLNQVEPFYRGAILYVMAFLCACTGWVLWGPALRRAALGLIGLGFALQLLGLVARVYLTGYAMVTSLYSSALFVGFIGVLAGLILELWFKRGIGAAVASSIGFVTLVIAYNLPFSGDNLARPQAVLATNLWLSTHVTCVTTGYGAMFVAGALGIGYIFYRSFMKAPDRGTLKLLAQLTYGVTCFATLFSFVGTMLGGIWADQSWGRFWGWDPKENGALLIVLWCAICLHARWGKLCTERGQAALAVGGNMVTAWSWFGVNLLGVGLHSYGFMQGTFVTLILFWLSQFLIIGLAYLPPRFWERRVVVVQAAVET